MSNNNLEVELKRIKEENRRLKLTRRENEIYDYLKAIVDRVKVSELAEYFDIGEIHMSKHLRSMAKKSAINAKRIGSFNYWGINEL